MIQATACICLEASSLAFITGSVLEVQPNCRPYYVSASSTWNHQEHVSQGGKAGPKGLSNTVQSPPWLACTVELKPMPYLLQFVYPFLAPSGKDIAKALWGADAHHKFLLCLRSSWPRAEGKLIGLLIVRLCMLEY